MDYVALKAELTADPLSRGYSGMSDSAAAAPLTLGDYEFANASPYDLAESIGTVMATGGTAPYAYRIVSETMA